MRNSFRTQCPTILQIPKQSHWHVCKASEFSLTSSLTQAQAPCRSLSTTIIHREQGLMELRHRKGKCPGEQWVISVSGFPQLPRITRTFGMGTGLSPRPIIITTVSFSLKKSLWKMGTVRAGKLSEENSLTILGCWKLPTGEAQEETRL